MNEQLTLWGLPVIIDSHAPLPWLLLRWPAIPLHVHAYQLHRPGVGLPVWRSHTFTGPKCVVHDESCGTP